MVKFKASVETAIARLLGDRFGLDWHDQQQRNPNQTGTHFIRSKPKPRQKIEANPIQVGLDWMGFFVFRFRLHTDMYESHLRAKIVYNTKIYSKLFWRFFILGVGAQCEASQISVGEGAMETHWAPLRACSFLTNASSECVIFHTRSFRFLDKLFCTVKNASRTGIPVRDRKSEFSKRRSNYECVSNKKLDANLCHAALSTNNKTVIVSVHTTMQHRDAL